MKNLTKKQIKSENIRFQEARKHLKELRLFAAQNLIKICDGDLAGALNALIKSYGHLYGKNEQKQVSKECEPVDSCFNIALEQSR